MQIERTSGWIRRWSRRLFGGLRVAVYLCVVSGTLGWLAARSAHGHVGEAGLAVGRQLAGLEDLTGSSHRVRLNGQVVNVASAVTAAPVAGVLDRLERTCKEGSVARELEALAAVLPAPFAEIEPGTARGVLRKESKRDGMVACLLAMPGQKQSSLAERLARFEKTMNLADVGLLRYAYARTLPSGRTHVLTSWTEHAFDVGALIAGGTEDAPGSDVPGAARPAQSVRLLTAEIEGAPHATRIYESTLPPAALLDGMSKDMEIRGFAAVGLIERQVPHGRAFSRDGLDVLVFAFEHGSGSVVSMVTTSAGR